MYSVILRWNSVTTIIMEILPHVFCAVLYRHLRTEWLCHISPHYLINITIFGGKNLLNIKCEYEVSFQPNHILASHRTCNTKSDWKRTRLDAEVTYLLTHSVEQSLS
jgi:hypothetical protein